MPLQAWLNRIWYAAPRPPPWLRPFAALYAALTALHRFSFRAGWRRVARVDCPVIIVGNLTVGGTGKTPLVAWLCRTLAGEGLRPGIVTRGYGGSARGVQLVTAAADAAQVGDEALLLMRRAGVPVAVGRDRPQAAQVLIAAGCNVIVSDDGLQHLALPRACEIVVIDAQRGFGNGALLPAGPLRESVRRLGSVAAIVRNGSVSGPDAPAHGTPGFTMRLRPLGAMSLADAELRPLSAFAGQTVHAVAGIGNPGRFFSMLQDCGITVIAHPRDDHAPLRPAELQFGDGRSVLMTEKDAVKCSGAGLAGLWSVPVEAGFEPAEAAALVALVRERIAGGNRTAAEETGGQTNA
jgi:tetraacyldisaccharide 4'-kinase